MSRLLLICYACLCLFYAANAQDGDTTIVQTFTWESQNNPSTAYDSPGRRWFQFPASDNGISYQKILMYYNLKCFSTGTAGDLGYPCGEWDYLTYTYLYDHTGNIDSNAVDHPLYMVNNLDFDIAALTSQPVQISREYAQIETVIDESTNTNETTIGTGGGTINGPLSAHAAQRSQYLYRAEDLIAAGLISGQNIGTLALQFTGNSSSAQLLKIQYLWTSEVEINQFNNSASFQTIYAHDTDISVDGWLNLNTSEGFSWDGTSSLLLQVLHTNPQQLEMPMTISDIHAYPCSFSASATDRYMKFDWQDEVRVPASAFEAITNEVSISFWQFGNVAAQPQDGTLFEGVNAQNQRVLNVHLPWSNSRVYWDAGNESGSYDRIDKLATAANYEGKWNHWVFTKNATTGSMKIYLNGVLWHSGTSMDNTMEGITRFSIGGATSWSNFYNGSIDEFAIFNAELDAATISGWMKKDLNATHPFWNNLQVYYQFNEENQAMVLDASGHGRDAWMHGNADRILYRSEELWRNGVSDFSIPQLKLITGNFVTHDEASIGSWIEEVPPVSVVQYGTSNYQVIPVNIYYAWEEQNSFTITVEGDTIDEVFIPAEFILNNEEFSYWQTPYEVVDRYELNRFITMYGIQLSLGSDGWTWVTDVTDWQPMLRDSVELESGNWQELLDLKFVFIEGTPAREVKRVERVWDTNVNLSNFDNVVTDKVIQKLPGETMWKIATTNTGHGFGSGNNCGEFCNNIQSVEVNGTEHWSWDILQKCSTNPLYPQGGTWIYDRAGWCPGMNSKTNEFELTPFVGEGNDFTIDYDITTDPYGNYVFFTTLFGYGNPNHQHDPEIDMITAPSDWKIHSRWNPICDNPKFILRNKGALPLTDLNIYYGVTGGTVQSFHWTGNLTFMESEEVELTYTDALMWEGDDSEELTFFVNLGLSTDGADDNPSNNYAENHFTRPPIYQYSSLNDNRVIIQLKTNASYTQTSYTLYDIDGDVVFERADFDAPFVTYRDTVELEQGCYMFHLKDSGEDGLRFFANDDGNGSCKFDRVGSFDLHSFEPDFGKEIIHYFYWKTNVLPSEINEIAKTGVRIFPNPATQTCNVQLTGFEKNASLKIFDQYGKLVYSENCSRKAVHDSIQLDLHMLSSGVYHIQLSDSRNSAVARLVKV